MTELLPLNTSPLPLKLRVEDYLLLDASGAFESYQKTELIEGEVYFVNAQHRPHALAKAELYDASRCVADVDVDVAATPPDRSQRGAFGT